MNGQANEIIQWIIKGDHDLGTEKVTFLNIPDYTDTVAFHCQQAIEKYLKAYLIFQGTTFRFSHDLVYLLDLITLNDTDFEVYYDSFSELQAFSVEVRYPNEIILISREQIEKTIRIAKEIRDLVLNKIKISVDYNKIID